MGNSQLQEGETLGTAVQAPTLNSGETLGDVVQANGGASGSWDTSGETINDVGNTVITPRDGESFSDTMKRAAAQGQKTTPEQIQKEVSTMPEKAAETLGVASVPLIAAGVGAGGGALLEATSKMVPTGSGFTSKLIEEEGPSLAKQGLNKAIGLGKAFINSPTTQAAARIAEGAGIGMGGYYGFRHWWDSTHGGGK